MRRKRLIIMKAEAEEKKTTPKKETTYVDIIPSQRMNIADGIDLVFSVSQSAEEGEPHLDIRTYVKTDRYTGPTKKGINFNIESLEEFRGILEAIEEQLIEKGL